MTNLNPAPAAGAGELPDDDPRSAFADAVGVARQAIGGVRPDQLEDPTPCPDMDVRALLGHLVDVLHRVTALGRGQDPFALDARAPVADDAWSDAWQRAAHEVMVAWSDDAVLERTVVLPWSRGSGADTLCGYLNEVVVHTWDLAAATGQQPAWDERVLAEALAAIQRLLPVDGRAARFAAAAEAAPDGLRGFAPPFAEAVEVPAAAPLLDRLIAWNGRSPQPAAAVAAATTRGR